MRTGTWVVNRAYARRHLPKGVFDYVDGGAEDEVTVRENRRAFSDLSFKARVLSGAGTRDQSADVLGQRLQVPVITAPTGLSRMAGPEGEKAAAIGAEQLGTVSILSSGTSIPMASVAASVTSPQWLQVYLYNDERMTLGRLEAARENGFRVLVVTADAPISGNRERDVRNGMTMPFRITPQMMGGVLRRPRWLADYLLGPPLIHEEGVRPPGMVRRMLPARDDGLANVLKGMFNAGQRWSDLERIRSLWDGPLVLKGVMCAEDARLAADIGCDGIVVSNHGGRQLDGLPATIDVLPEVVAEVGDQVDVLLDSGIRRGTDVVKALALGAKACLIGRPWVFGLANGGAAGVAAVLRTLHDEIDRTMALVGASSIAELTPAILRRRNGSGWTSLSYADEPARTEVREERN